MFFKTKKILFLFASFFSVSVSAEEVTFNMGVAAAKYIGSVAVMQEVSQSECGYAIEKEYSIEKVTDEVKRYFKGNDRLDFVNLTNSINFDKDIEGMQQDLFHEPFEILLEEGVDNKTACGMLIGGYVKIYQDSKSEFNIARERYLNAKGP